MKKISILLLLNVFFLIQNFSQFKLLPDSLLGLRNGELTCTDFDSDGDLDILTFGDDTLAQIYSIFYRNDDLTFNPFNMEAFPNLYDGAIDWSDYNNNGHMDLALIGWSGTDNKLISKVLEFNSDFKNTNLKFPGISRGSVDWGDYNKDGYIDLLIVGQDNNSNSVTKLFENKKSMFEEVNISNVTGVSFGDAAWADYNSDGMLDFIITGVTGQAPQTGSPVTQLYKNTGNGFELVLDTTFIGVYESSIDWGDADNDGDLDIIITGFTKDYLAFTGLYINDSNTFHLVKTSLPNILEGFAKWGDFDNDNDLDILISGDSIGSRIFKVFENDSLKFLQVFEGPGVSQSSGAWADFNNDGLLDIIINGQKNDLGLIASIYLNDSTSVNKSKSNRFRGSTFTSLKSTSNIYNQPPSIPENLNSEVIGTKVTLTWDASFDDYTSSKSLSYSINLLKEEQLVIPSLSNSNGIRSLIEPGNAGLLTFFVTDSLVPGNYSWSVQSIDNSFKASSFSDLVFFTIEEQPTNTESNENLKIIEVVYPNPCKDYIFVKNSDLLYSFQLININGQMIYSGTTTDEKISLKRFENGTYFLKINLKDNVLVKKIIKN